jgi:hypothetical protein
MDLLPLPLQLQHLAHQKSSSSQVVLMAWLLTETTSWACSSLSPAAATVSAGGTSAARAGPPLPAGFQRCTTPSGNCKYVAACPQHGEASICKLWNLQQYLSKHSVPGCRRATAASCLISSLQAVCYCKGSTTWPALRCCSSLCLRLPCWDCRPEWAHLCQGMGEDRNAYSQRLQQHGFVFGPGPSPQEGRVQPEQAESAIMEKDAPKHAQAGASGESPAQAASQLLHAVAAPQATTSAAASIPDPAPLLPGLAPAVSIAAAAAAAPAADSVPGAPTLQAASVLASLQGSPAQSAPAQQAKGSRKAQPVRACNAAASASVSAPVSPATQQQGQTCTPSKPAALPGVALTRPHKSPCMESAQRHAAALIEAFSFLYSF